MDYLSNFDDKKQIIKQVDFPKIEELNITTSHY